MTYIQDATRIERKGITKVFIEKITLSRIGTGRGIPLGDEDVTSVLQTVQKTVCMYSRSFQQTRIAMFI